MPESPQEQEFSEFARSMGIPDGTRLSGQTLQQLQSAFMSFKSRQPSQSRTGLDTANANLANQRALTVEADRTAAASAPPDRGGSDFEIAMNSLQGNLQRTGDQRRDRAASQFFQQKQGDPQGDRRKARGEQLKQRVSSLKEASTRPQAFSKELRELVDFYAGDGTTGPQPELQKAAQKELDRVNKLVADINGSLTNLALRVRGAQRGRNGAAAPQGANGTKRACDPNKMVTRVVKVAGGRDRLGNDLSVGSTIRVSECAAFEMEDAGHVDPPEVPTGGDISITPITPTPPIPPHIIFTDPPPEDPPPRDPPRDPPPHDPPAEPEGSRFPDVIADQFELSTGGADKRRKKKSLTQAQRRGRRVARFSAPATGK